MQQVQLQRIDNMLASLFDLTFYAKLHLEKWSCTRGGYYKTIS